jgi:CRISPR-associated protein Csm5
VRYRVTCLTPTLVGGGNRLSPIDYMVWKDQVNVLDQTRIFKLLSRGPRLEGYLTQLKKATKLDFASWGGFAQNYADRRIPFSDSSLSRHWERAQGDSLNIPLFAAGTAGPYLPATAIKGALHTGLLQAAWKDSTTREIAQRAKGDRPPRRPAEFAEDNLLGSSGSSRMRWAGVADSGPVGYDSFKVYLVRVSTLMSKTPGQYSLGWKQIPRGAVDGRRPEDSTAAFLEMAQPGSSFEGAWNEHEFFNSPEVRRVLRWSEPMTRERLFTAANEYARKILDLHARYTSIPTLERLNAKVQQLEARLAEAHSRGACLLPIGWGGGYLGKSALLDTQSPEAREVLVAQPAYERAIKSGLPFPKTRHIIFEQDHPSTLPGWVELEVS